jgi:hemin uptake protein HemP
MLNVKDNMANKSQAGKPRIIISEALFAGSRELVIKHVGDDYRLRLTSQGKLILTK